MPQQTQVNPKFCNRRKKFKNWQISAEIGFAFCQTRPIMPKKFENW